MVLGPILPAAADKAQHLSVSAFAVKSGDVPIELCTGIRQLRAM
jgi:hypothetical protein